MGSGFVDPILLYLIPATTTRDRSLRTGSVDRTRQWPTTNRFCAVTADAGIPLTMIISTAMLQTQMQLAHLTSM